MSSRVSSGVLIGREAELAALESRLRRAVSGEPSLTVVVGEAGVGKTRLISEALAGAREQGMLTLRGECVDLADGEFPYAPIAGALGELAAGPYGGLVAELSPQASSELGRAFPQLTREGPKPVSSADEPLARPRLYEALIGLLRRVGESVPTVLALEDLHWADGSTRDLLAVLMSRLHAERLAVVVSVRTETRESHPIHALLAAFTRNPIASRLDLSRLNHADATALAAALTGSQPTRALADELFARAHGNPFFVEELVAAYRQGLSRELPDSLRDALLLRLRDLEPESRRLMDIIAVVGRPADEALLDVVAGLSPDELVHALRDAVEHHVLDHDATTGGFDFRHALVREAVYSRLLAPERVAIHAAIADALEADGGLGNAPQRAYHWYEAGEERAALNASIEAGLLAESRGGFAEALAHFERALGLWPGEDPPDVPLGRLAVHAHATDAARAAGKYERAAALCEEALASFDHASHRERASRFFGRLGRSEPWKIAESIDRFRAARQLVPPEALAQQSRLLGDEAWAWIYLARWEDARHVAEEALRIAQLAASPADAAWARSAVGVAVAFLGSPSDGEAQVREAQLTAQEMGTPQDKCRIAMALAEVLRLQGRIGAAFELMLEAERAAAEGGVKDSLGNFIAVDSANDMLSLGRWRELEERLEQIADEPLSPTGQLLYETVVGQLNLRRGDLEAARRHLDRAAELWTAGNAVEYVPALYAARAELHLRLGDPPRACEEAALGIRLVGSAVDALHAPRLYSAAVHVQVETGLAAWELGDDALSADAGATARRLRDDLAERLDALPQLSPTARAHLLTCDAELTRLSATADADAWRAAAEAWEAVDQPYCGACARRRQAEALLDTPDRRDDAATPLLSARAVARELGAAPLCTALEQLARRAGLDLAGRPVGLQR